MLLYAGRWSKRPPGAVLIGFFLLFCLGLSFAVNGAESRTVKVDPETDISVEVHPADGDLLLIWQPHDIGMQEIDRRIAQRLSEQGIEVWRVDVLEAYFLPNTASSMDRIPAEAFAALLAAASRSGKSIVVAASGRSAIPTLRGMHRWQQTHADSPALAGAILLSPKLFVETPDPGIRPELMPVVQATNQAIVILQPDKSPWYWKLEQTLEALRRGGSDVYLWPLPGLRDRFYFRPDASDAEQQAARQLADKLAKAVRLLGRSTRVVRAVQAINEPAPVVQDGKKPRELQAYPDRPPAPPLVLPDVQGARIDLRELRGKVVLVNFWASWCPPCVHEMPSMQRLQDRLATEPFTILGVDMGEDVATVETFLREKVNVRFPIVLDSDGQALKAWGVFAFPTSYVIDKQGRIRYTLSGAVEWDAEAIGGTLRQLTEE